MLICSYTEAHICQARNVAFRYMRSRLRFMFNRLCPYWILVLIGDKRSVEKVITH